MKRYWIVLAASVSFTCSAQALDNAGAQALMKKDGCDSCHEIDKKVVGPAFRDVAAKYKGDKAAEATLAKKVKDGGKGVWGDMVMPPNAHVKDADIAALVKWVLAQK